jgi:3-deoxy-D-manno-octulosonic-acid transferase
MPFHGSCRCVVDARLMLDLLYILLVILALPWVIWRRMAGRRPVAAVWQRLTGAVSLPPTPAGHRRIWLHGVSVGEVALLASLAARLRHVAEAEGEHVECVLSSSTTTGLEVARSRFSPNLVFPCPLDFSWAVRRVLKGVQPDLLVLGELELWPQLLALTAGRGIPIAVVNARMSEQSFCGYQRIAPIARRMLERLTIVIARSEDDAARFRALGAPHVIVAGSMKYDGARGDRNSADVHRLSVLAGIGPDDVVFLAGSTQHPEESLAIEAFRQISSAHACLRLILVPRHVERSDEVAELLDASGLAWQRRSRLESDGVAPACRVLLVDATGELAAWWGTANIAFVGGSLDGKRGGQNMLEPSAYGAAVAFGPHTRNFQAEVAGLLAVKAARVVHDQQQLTEFVTWGIEHQADRDAMGARAAAVVAAGRGATDLTIRRLLSVLRRMPAA